MIVGSTYFAGYDRRANLWTETAAGWVQTDLNTLLPSGSAFWKLDDAYDVNAKGQILGLGAIAGDDFAHVFLLTPVPEVSHWQMMLAGLLAVTLAAARRANRAS